jgi:hypothetical protein
MTTLWLAAHTRRMPMDYAAISLIAGTVCCAQIPRVGFRSGAYILLLTSLIKLLDDNKLDSGIGLWGWIS